MNDLDQLLRDAGARLRDTAPSAEATEAALAGLADVRLDESGLTHRRRLWVIAPAILAAAAVMLGVLVLTRPGDEAITPADTTTVRDADHARGRAHHGAVTVSGPVTVPETVPATTDDATPVTTAGEEEVEILAGVFLRTTDVDFDGDGGACLTVRTDTTEIRGCVDGPTRRGAYGRPFHFRIDDIPAVLFPAGIDGSGQPELVIASTTPSACSAANEVPGQMIEEASCSDGVSIVRTLPTTPDPAPSWTVVGAQQQPTGTGVELVAVDEAAGARVFRTPPVGGLVALPDRGLPRQRGARGVPGGADLVVPRRLRRGAGARRAGRRHGTADGARPDVDAARRRMCRRDGERPHHPAVSPRHAVGAALRHR